MSLLRLKIYTCVLAVMLLTGPSVSLGQGLKGTDLDPKEIGGRAPIPDLIPGKDDGARWLLVTKTAPCLIGMKKKQVRFIFGKGAERYTGELTYQITKGLPERHGTLACIELRIKFKHDAVEEFSIAALRWL